ncbi:MAG: alginate export family protein [Candidatus Limnocylindria bacterium]
MRAYGIALLPAMLGALLASAAQAGDAAPSRPRYADLRYQENWSVLAGQAGAPGGDFFDPVKYIPLDDSGAYWLSFGAQLRERVELWENFGFGAPPGQGHDDAFLLSRLYFHSDLHLTPWVRVFAQGKSAFVTDRDLPGGNRKSDVDQLDLQNGFLDLNSPELWGAKLTLRGGRQEMAFGAQRLVSPLDWANTRRTFDGGSAILSYGTWQAHGFWMRPVQVNRYSFNDWGPHDSFYGIYSSGLLGETGIRTDLYWLGLGRDDASFNGTSGHEKRQTFGARVFGPVSGTPLDFEVEGAYQLGEVGPGDVSAFMVASQLGWWFETISTSPRLFVGFDWASGDENPGGDVQTFNQLFPLSHQYYGFIDAIARQNAVDGQLGFVLRPLPALTTTLTGHLFWRADHEDALYSAAGAVSRAGSSGSSPWLGAEIDLLVRYQLDVHAAFSVGYSRFFTGNYLRESGRGRDIDFAYWVFQYTF